MRLHADKLVKLPVCLWVKLKPVTSCNQAFMIGMPDWVSAER